MTSKETKIPTETNRITGRNGHFEMTHLVIRSFSDNDCYIDGQGKHGKILNAGLRVETDVFAKAALPHISDEDLIDELRNRNYVMPLWHRDDVVIRAIDQNVLLTEYDIETIMYRLENNNDATIGINWDVIDSHIDMIVQGRPNLELTGALCHVRYNDGDETVGVFHFDHSEPGEECYYDDDDVFFYCNGPHNVFSFLNPLDANPTDDSDFIITEVLELYYPQPKTTEI